MKQFLIYVIVLVMFPFASFAADIATAPELGTATAQDAISAVDASASAGSRLRRILFDGDGNSFLSGLGTWIDLSAVYEPLKGSDDNYVTDAEKAALHAAGSDNQTAATVSVDATGFDGNLVTSDNTVQKVAQKFDDLVVSGGGLSASDVLTRTNTDAYTPSADYHPATKKYVDDTVSGAGGYTDESAQDAVGAMVSGNTETNISVTYDDAGNKLNFAVDLSGYLTTGGTAANASQLEGHAASYFQTALTNPIVAAGAQSITGTKTFDKGTLKVKGTSTGSTDLTTSNASGTNYTATFPAKTGTIAMTSDITGTNSGTNTGDVTINTANGLSLSGQALSLAASTNSSAGAATSAQITELERLSGALTDGANGEHGVWLTNNTTNPNTYSSGKWGYTVYNNAPYWCYNGTCTAIPTSSSGISHATSDGNYYASRDGGWVSLLNVYQPYNANLTSWAAIAPSAKADVNASTTGSAGSLKSNATTGVMQIVGPAAGTTRVLTVPDANATVATTGANTFTGTQALGTNNLTMTGSIAATGARVTKVWTSALESTAMPTVNGVSLPSTLAAQSGVHATPTTTTPLSPTWTGVMYTVWYNATGTINLPAASGYTGKGILIYNTGTNVITVDSNGAEVIVRDGTAQTGGVSMTLSGGAGNYVALLCDGARWVTLGYKGTLAQGS